MIRTRFFLPAVLALLWMAPSLRSQIPKSMGRTLEGADVSLPDLFQQKPVVVVLGLSQKSSEEARTWSRRLMEAERQEGRNDVYGLILLARVPRALRGLIARAIRSDVPLPVQSHFVILGDREEEWRVLAKVNSPDDAYILVLNARGAVCGREHGPYTDERLALVEKTLKQAAAETCASAPVLWSARQ